MFCPSRWAPAPTASLPMYTTVLEQVLLLLLVVVVVVVMMVVVGAAVAYFLTFPGMLVSRQLSAKAGAVSRAAAPLPRKSN